MYTLILAFEIDKWITRTELKFKNVVKTYERWQNSYPQKIQVYQSLLRRHQHKRKITRTEYIPTEKIQKYSTDYLIISSLLIIKRDLYV